MAAKIGSFIKDGRTFPTIELKGSEKNKFGFSFGVSKARLILEHFEDIASFGDGIAVGAAHVGHVLGMGRPAHFGAGAVPHVSRRAGAVAHGR